MSYIDGFVAAVPTNKRDEFIAHAKEMAAMCMEYGVVSVTECWGDDVPDGEVTSFPMAVKKADDETVVFSWMTWPSKDARDAGWKAMMDDPRMQPDKMSMPFDGKRLIFGGFAPIFETQAGARA